MNIKLIDLLFNEEQRQQYAMIKNEILPKKILVNRFEVKIVFDQLEDGLFFNFEESNCTDPGSIKVRLLPKHIGIIQGEFVKILHNINDILIDKCSSLAHEELSEVDYDSLTDEQKTEQIMSKLLEIDSRKARNAMLKSIGLKKNKRKAILDEIHSFGH